MPTPGSAKASVTTIRIERGLIIVLGIVGAILLSGYGLLAWRVFGPQEDPATDAAPTVVSETPEAVAADSIAVQVPAPDASVPGEVAMAAQDFFVTSGTLNVREKPGADQVRIGSLSRNDVFTVVARAPVTNQSGVSVDWARGTGEGPTGAISGWVSMAYLRASAPPDPQQGPAQATPNVTDPNGTSQRQAWLMEFRKQELPPGYYLHVGFANLNADFASSDGFITLQARAACARTVLGDGTLGLVSGRALRTSGGRARDGYYAVFGPYATRADGDLDKGAVQGACSRIAGDARVVQQF